MEDTVQEEQGPENEIDTLVREYNIKLPKYWDELNDGQKLDFIAHRILLDTRGTTKHTEMKEQGWLSNSQLERRRRREVLSKFGSWDEVPPQRGVFSRPHNPESKDK